MSETTTGAATSMPPQAPAATEKFKFNVDDYFARLPRTTKEFFDQVQAGFEADVKALKAKTDGRIERLESALKAAQGRAESLERFQDQQRLEVNRLNEENKKLLSEQGKGAAEIGPLRLQVAMLKNELLNRRNAERTLAVRDQTIEQLRENNRVLKRQLEQARRLDLQAVIEDLRTRNKGLQRQYEELGQALHRCQTQAAADSLEMGKKISDLLKRNEDLEKLSAPPPVPSDTPVS